jgi:hypothetical protein
LRVFKFQMVALRPDWEANQLPSLLMAITTPQGQAAAFFHQLAAAKGKLLFPGRQVPNFPGPPSVDKK